MGRLGIGADAAFALLCAYSNHTNKKLAAIASQLVGLAEDSRNAAALTALGHDLQRHIGHTAFGREPASAAVSVSPASVSAKRRASCGWSFSSSACFALRCASAIDNVVSAKDTK
jgi:hypothetical protein